MMTDVLIQEQYLQNIANAIRNHNGLNDTYQPKEMAAAIKALPITSSGESIDEDAYLSDTLTTLSSDTLINIGSRAFHSNTALHTVNLPNATYIGDNAFSACNNLVNVSIPNVTYLGEDAFSSCDALRKIDLPSVTYIGDGGLYVCDCLVTVILRASTVCELGGSYVFDASSNSVSCPMEKGTGYIYVPAALVDAYKSAPYWMSYSNQIRAIEDYPDICGE